MKNLKIADLHIGLSDAVHILGKNPLVDGVPTGDIPNQFDIHRARSSDLALFGAFMCPIGFTKNGSTYLPTNQKYEIREHLKAINDFAKNTEFEIMGKINRLNKPLKVIFIGLEGVYFVKGTSDFDFLLELIDRGVKFIAPVWNYKSNLFINGEVSSLGKDFLKVCYQNNVVIDLAHAESLIDIEIVRNFNGRIINSHTAIFEINKHKRNIKLDVAMEICKRDGLVGISFVSNFIGGNRIEDLVQHFVKAVELLGIDHVAFGSDFDGMSKDEVISGIEDVSKYNNLVLGLSRFLSEEDLKKVGFENVFNYLSNNIS